MKFNDLGIIPTLINAVKEIGYSTAMEIQKKSIPMVLSGKDERSEWTEIQKLIGFEFKLKQ